jgi:hypothetical protein
MGAWASSVESVGRVISQAGITWRGPQTRPHFFGRYRVADGRCERARSCAAWRHTVRLKIVLHFLNELRVR